MILANSNNLFRPAEMPSKYQTTTEDPNPHHLIIKGPGGQEKVTKEVAKEAAKAKIKMVRLYRKRGAPHLVVKRTQTYVIFTRQANVPTVIDVIFGIHQSATSFQTAH